MVSRTQDYAIRESDNPDTYGRGYGAGRDDGYHAALTDLAAGMGLELDYARKRATVGRGRLWASGGDLTLAISQACLGERERADGATTLERQIENRRRFWDAMDGRRVRP